MITPIHVILFDLGNTLFYDNAAKWPKTYARAESALWRELRRSGVTTAPDVVYGKADTLLGHYYAIRGSDVLEPGAFQVLRDLLTPHVPSIPDATVTRALRAMYKVTQTNWRVERAAAPTLRALHKRGLRIGAVSNGSYDWNALELLNRAGLRRYFEMVLTSDAFGRRKPDPSIFDAALTYFRVKPERVVMIGDSYEADILGASRLGIQTIWITRRLDSATLPGVVKPEAILGDIREVPGILGEI